MVTIRDVSALAHVSKSTVSRVVANNGAVSPSARKRVEEAIRVLGYRPNQSARNLKQQKSNTLGVVVVDLASPFYSQILGGVQQTAEANGKHMVVTSGHGDKEAELAAVQSLLDRQCDGLLVFIENDFPAEVFNVRKNQSCPVVALGREVPQLAKSSVRVDNYRGGYLAAKHLVEAGHKHIAHLAGPNEYEDARLRKQGFLDAMEEGGIPKSQYRILTGEYTERAGYELTRKLFAEPNALTAICSGDDDMAAGVYSALRDLNIAIPNQVSVVGYDDNFHARHLYPSLTTVRQPIVQMGEIAVELLLKTLQQPDLTPQQIVLMPELIQRDSVRFLNRD